MKQIILILALVAGPAAAEAACYADYKAKRENPLRLHYGVAKIDGAACTKKAARAALKSRLADDGWALLNVVSVFDADGLEKRKGSAGQYHLRY